MPNPTKGSGRLLSCPLTMGRTGKGHTQLYVLTTHHQPWALCLGSVLGWSLTAISEPSDCIFSILFWPRKSSFVTPGLHALSNTYRTLRTGGLLEGLSHFTPWYLCLAGASSPRKEHKAKSKTRTTLSALHWRSFKQVVFNFTSHSFLKHSAWLSFKHEVVSLL